MGTRGEALLDGEGRMGREKEEEDEEEQDRSRASTYGVVRRGEIALGRPSHWERRAARCNDTALAAAGSTMKQVDAR